MELSNRVVQVRSTLKPEEEEFPSFNPDDIILPFSDVAKPVGLVLNHNNPNECFVVFPNSESVPDILKLADTPKWVGTHMIFTVDWPRVEIIAIIAKPWRMKPWRKGRNINLFHLKNLKQRGQHTFLPQRMGRNLLPLC